MGLKFSQAHDLVLQKSFLAVSNPSLKGVLRTVGFWYHRHLTVGQPHRVCLRVPYYHKDLPFMVKQYLFYLDLYFKLADRPPVQEFGGLALFDLLEYDISNEHKRGCHDFTLAFEGQSEEALWFQGGVTVRQSRFLPLFFLDDIQGSKFEIYNSLPVFKALAQTAGQQRPVRINPAENCTLMVSQSSTFDRPVVQSLSVNTCDFRDTDACNEWLDDLEDVDVRRSIILRYPYHQNISSTILQELEEKGPIFEVDLASRFFYREISEIDIVITPKEVNGVEDCLFNLHKDIQVLKTNHNEHAFSDLKELRAIWKELSPNPYLRPFPIKWLVSVHAGKSPEEWFELFQKDHPWAQPAILTRLGAILQALCELDWTSRFLPRDEWSTIVIPDILTSPIATNSLRKQLSDRFQQVLTWEELEAVDEWPADLVIIDPYNVSNLINRLIGIPEGSVTVLIPDLFYFSCVPYIRWHANAFLSDSLVKGAREWLDPAFPENLLKWKGQNDALRVQLAEEQRCYLAGFKMEPHPEEWDEGLKSEVVATEMTVSEADNLAVRTEIRKSRSLRGQRIRVTTVEEKNFALNPETEVLIELDGHLVRSTAAVLDKGSRFIPVDMLTASLDIKKLAERSSKIEERSLNWHRELAKIRVGHPKLYKELCLVGLTVSEHTFNNEYLVPKPVDGVPRLPRSTKDWEVVSRRLGLKDADLLWIAGRCRGNLNRIRTMYQEVIRYLVDSRNLGENVPEKVIDHVRDLIDQCLGPQEDHNHPHLTDPKPIIKSINQGVDLLEIKEIEYEQLTT